MAFSVTALLVVVTVAVLEPVTGSTATGLAWSYEQHHGVLDPPHWNEGYPVCDDYRQSPIDIRNPISDSHLVAFDMHKYKSTSNSFLELENVGGHTVEIGYSSTDDVSVSGGNLPGNYKLAQFHFHWGSEHLINGKRFPLEMHMVHYKESYGSLKHAMEIVPDGLVVLSFLFEETSVDNAALEPILRHFKDVTYKDTKTEVPYFPVYSILPANAETGKYYRYGGSLTTPPCFESVIWTVFDQKIKISTNQLKQFKALQSVVQSDDDDAHSHPIIDNFRPPQALNGRKIYTNGDHDDRRKRHAHVHPHSAPYGHVQSHLHQHGGGSAPHESHGAGGFHHVPHSGGNGHPGSQSEGGVTHSSGGVTHSGGGVTHSGGGVTHSGGGVTHSGGGHSNQGQHNHHHHQSGATTASD